MSQVRVLSLSTNYPSPIDNRRGLFVRSRLQHVARILPVRVVSPVELVDYARGGNWRGALPGVIRDGALDVGYPRWFYLPHGGMSNGWFMAVRLLPYLRAIRRDFPFTVLDAHFGHPEGVAAAILSAALGVPFTVTLRGSEVLHAEKRGRKRQIAWALRRAARVIVVAGNLRRLALALGVDPGRIHLIPNGIEAEIFYPRPRAETRLRLGMPERRPVILMAGHLIELKGQHRVVRSLAELRRQGVDAELWLAGGGGRAASFECQIRDEVRRHALEHAVRFLGALSQEALADHMSAADVLCLASSREGWPNVVHEALGCGAPVVATNVGGVEDLLPSGEYGIIVPPLDDLALTAALREALAKPWDRDRIATWARSRSWTQVAAETAAALREASEDRG